MRGGGDTGNAGKSLDDRKVREEIWNKAGRRSASGDEGIETPNWSVQIWPVHGGLQRSGKKQKFIHKTLPSSKQD